MAKKEEPVIDEAKKEPKEDDSNDSVAKDEEPPSAEKFYSRDNSMQDLGEDPPQGKSRLRHI